ncbi:DUF1127 domain-containing protein [uncultured Cohaesibacter sp.]|uniref:DUF1127 domain-containing protein n=1 Tax=uncultured Cohaesibacter sp. TaxID=1002546 RepID=UPI0029C97946|nr:DUF1127 domain-containing protein [uncultured Cohaesibacter sp.]
MLTVILHSALASAVAGVARLVAAGATIARNRAALKSLAELDERTLADIGLTRSDVITASAQPLYRDPLLIDPFDARRRIHSRELDILARWYSPASDLEYPQPAEERAAAKQAPLCCDPKEA